MFEGDEYTTLMTQCKEGAQREGLMLDSSEELYKWFTQQVKGFVFLHVNKQILCMCIYFVTTCTRHTVYIMYDTPV